MRGHPWTARLRMSRISQFLKLRVRVFFNNDTVREASRRTDRASDCNHLQVSSLQLCSETGVGRSLCGCGVVIFSWINCLRGLGDMGAGVPFEAVDESSPPHPLGLCVTRSEVVPIRTAPARRRQIQVLLWIGVRGSGVHGDDVVEEYFWYRGLEVILVGRAECVNGTPEVVTIRQILRKMQIPKERNTSERREGGVL
jgi:hypothetical protein